MITVQLDAFHLSIIFFISMSQTISVINRSRACYFLHASFTCAGMCMCDCVHQMEKIEFALFLVLKWIFHDFSVKGSTFLTEKIRQIGNYFLAIKQKNVLYHYKVLDNTFNLILHFLKSD